MVAPSCVEGVLLAVGERLQLAHASKAMRYRLQGAGAWRVVKLQHLQAQLQRRWRAAVAQALLRPSQAEKYSTH